MLGHFCIFIALQSASAHHDTTKNQLHSQRFNIADRDTPINWIGVWSALAPIFGLVAADPRPLDDEDLDPIAYVIAHADEWDAFLSRNRKMKGEGDVTQSVRTSKLWATNWQRNQILKSDRQLCLERTRMVVGFHDAFEDQAQIMRKVVERYKRAGEIP